MNSISNFQQQESYDLFKSKFEVLLDSADEIRSILLANRDSFKTEDLPVFSLFQIFCDSLEQTVENSLAYMANREYCLNSFLEKSSEPT